jgi:hypothetical protein
MKTSVRILMWIPRVIGILAILFIMLFSFDVFGSGEPVYKQILAFLMHNIPAFILAALLVFAWINEFTGGIVFTVIGVLFTAFLFYFNFNRTNSVWVGVQVALMLGLPFIIAGVLFILSHYAKKKNLTSPGGTN